MEEAIEEPLVTQEQWIEFMRKGEYHMKVRGINDFGPALVYPDFFIDGLAVWAVTVAAGIVVEFGMATIGALRDIDSEFSGFAAQNSPGGLALDIRLEVAGGIILPIGMLKDLPDFEIIHGMHLPSGQEG